MGSGSSFPQHDEFDLSDEPGVVKRIPIEMNPRRTFGGALRSVGSLGRRPRGVSLRSTFSVELDNTEVEKIRKEFEMYKISKQAEMGDSLKKVNKLENENRRLRAELQALQKTCDKLRTQRDLTLDAEYQALERASSFETERNKVQKQFKIFRESKESEIRDLLKAKEKFERALHHVDPEALSEMRGKDLADEANRFQELWPSLQSEPSIGSSTQLQSLRRAFDELEGFPTSSRAWTDLPSLSFAQTLTSFSFSPSSIRVYVSVSPDLSHDVLSFVKSREANLRHLCEKENRFLSLVSFSGHTEDEEDQFMNMHEVRRNEIKRSNILVVVVSKVDKMNSNCLPLFILRLVEEDLNLGYLSNPGERKTICLFHNMSEQATTLSRQVKSKGLAVIIEDDLTFEGKLNSLYLEIEKLLKLELGHDTTSEVYQACRVPSDVIDGPRNGALWDLYGENEQQQTLVAALDVCVSWAWLSNHVKRNPSCLVLYHFVGSPSSRSAVVVNMIQRLTSQVMQIVPSSQNLTSDPSRLLEEFPYWLEKVSTNLPDGVVLVIDSGDRFQNCEDNLAWLLDPLPVESRVIISAQVETCPKVWRSWPVLEIDPYQKKRLVSFSRLSL
ncbi:putative nephrocystin-3 [Apostichopus japonicus]|uniref:Putative nephrocystin-3 n=1 Tax=Stichopus japonicus TaxID=307972 RepID=A0A2G8JXV6_STIJA|nr:putative nephrocystin-3 [Apostichopus japonicus]